MFNNKREVVVENEHGTQYDINELSEIEKTIICDILNFINMGYSTDFTGSLNLSRPTTGKEKKYINLFGDTRRMKRDVDTLMRLYHGEHGNPFISVKDNPEAVYGYEGEYFTREDGEYWQKHDESILDYNVPPGQLSRSGSMEDWDIRREANNKRIADGVCQPSLWCQWRLNDDGTELKWDGTEKFYNYVEWLRYLIIHFFSKWGILLNGEISWEGEDRNDTGIIIVSDNVVTIKSK